MRRLLAMSDEVYETLQLHPIELLCAKIYALTNISSIRAFVYLSRQLQ